MPKSKKTLEERIAEIDAKISYHKDNVKKLEAKKKVLLTPKQKKAKTTVKAVMDKAKKAGMKPEEILEKLGLKED